MSNGHKLEFIIADETEIWLNYWDWLSGVNDTVFVLRDGKAYKKEDETEIECNLAEELFKLGQKVDNQVKFFYDEKDKRK